MIPENITKDHLVKAIKEIDKEGIPKGRQSFKYDLEYDKKKYPPLLVVSYANRIANGEEFAPNTLGGGPSSEAFKLLKKEGFIVNEKKEKLSKVEIENGIKLLCETSSEVEGFYQSDDNIVIALNNAHIEDLKQCAEYYATRSGVVIDIRKELINRLIEKEVFTVVSLNKLISKYKKGKEKQFRSYKETFSIVFPAITFYGHNKQRNFVESFTYQLINDLSIKENIKEVSFDFQGVRQQGSDRYWVAIYNKEQENQSKGIQFFFEFYQGKIGYGVYRHSNQTYIKPRKTLSPEEFNYVEMLNYFEASKELLLEDVPNANGLSKIPINAKVIYAYLKKSLSHRKIQKEVLGKEAPAKGGGFLAMEILHGYEIEGDKKGILNNIEFNVEYNNADGKYLEALELLKEFYPEFANESNKIIEMNFPLNTILYGPPGTGKTYNTILRAAQIIENRVIDSYDEALEVFKANLHDKIEFITFHQNYSYEDFIQGLRPDTENDNQLTFERKDGVFKEIADKALKNLTESEKPQLSKKPFEEVFNEFINPLVEGEIEEIEVKMKKVSYFITAISNKSIDFRKASGGTAHTLSIGTLKKMYLAESVLEIQGLASYYTPLLAELLKIGKDSSGKKEQIKRQNYVIIIDEINRANISRVFGELITLIEPDKRSHGSIPLEARLPSGDPFIVPSNLFIIGTMNTADKSIALLDIALRRRFEFESMYPKYEITVKKSMM